MTDITVSDIRIEMFENNDFINTIEFKWCIYKAGRRAPIGKLIACSSVSTDRSKNHMEVREAKIKVISVNSKERGRKLSQVLIEQCKKSLAINGFDLLVLEAEEDMSRFGKLVALYENCGFYILRNSKKQEFKLEYNDDQCFRVVPMLCNLKIPDSILKQNYEMGSLEHYKAVRTFQTYDYVREMHSECLLLNRCELTLLEALRLLDKHIFGSLSESIDFAEYIRHKGHPDWLQVVGLIHNLGKLQNFLLWRTPVEFIMMGREAENSSESKDDQQMSVEDGLKKGPALMPSCGVSDEMESWVVGCKLVESLLHPEFNQLNPDMKPNNSNSVDMSTDSGVYERHCGIDKVLLTWSHCEYLYTVLSANSSITLPKEALDAIRYQNIPSLTQNEETYSEIRNESSDDDALTWSNIFINLLDKYNHEKANEKINDDLEDLKAKQAEMELEILPYYITLFEKYLPNVIRW